MDTARQFLRYSIPGSLFLLLFLSMQLAWHVFRGQPVRTALAPLSGGFVLAVLGASIPIGFVLYQLYFGRYSPWVGFRYLKHVRWPRQDRGAVVLASLTCGQRVRLAHDTGARIDHRDATKSGTSRFLFAFRPLDIDEAWVGRDCDGSGFDHPMCTDVQPYDRPNPPDPSWRLDPYEAFEKRWRGNWDAVMTALEIHSADPRAVTLKREYVCLSDIYHSLGVTRLSLNLGGIAWLVYNIAVNGPSIHDHWWPFVWTAATTLTVVVATNWYLSAARINTQESMLRRLGAGLRAVLPG
ncbi:hypothetical protein SAMN05660199_04623 [Klenkia soli]|uniref:Uncharacterized protein n=1 Tax=Klenkia soli TaxID=1052260 RepID=A0A1H0UU16_9ACTN|nr:hypothetical protein [Klenkia soli]SDP69256.1 hypothetical protein SAMN05660199_04623 [Klenkia soli]